jgi:hypothetical protein
MSRPAWLAAAQACYPSAFFKLLRRGLKTQL